MKELSIEEKAKAYDKALEVLHKYDGTNIMFSQSLKEEMFPELAESEDEKVKKSLIRLVKAFYDVNFPTPEGFTKEQLLSWVEKQGENNTGISEATKQKLEDNLNMTLEKETQESWNKFLEKQDEQKPADKIEPKFQVGDWVITSRDSIFQIKAVNEGYYTIDNGTDFSISYVDKYWSLWTIQDAKDGDVLFTSSTASHEIFIFKSIDEKGNAKCYFAYDSEDGFREGKYHFIGRATDCKPATKEQRDLLFQKMHEAGYEWDAEKKELRKIVNEEQIKKNSPKDNWELIQEFVNKFGRLPKDQDELNVLVEYVLKRQNPTEWSEEDDKMLDIILNDINYAQKNFSDSKLIPYGRKVDWLKFLKVRVQPKQEWSKEDIDMIDYLIRCCEKEHKELCNDKYGHQDIISDLKRDCRKKWDWFESLKNKIVPQLQWKPSDEQMEILQYLCKHSSHPNEKVIPILESLYQDLKKLKG